MKSILFAATVFAFSFAQAEVKHAVGLRTVSFDGEKLSVSYTTGGGCQDHSAQFEISVTKGEGPLATAEVKVYDVSPKPDFCEAMVPVSGEINLNEAIAQKLKDAGIKVNYVEIKLPQILTTLN